MSIGPDARRRVAAALDLTIVVLVAVAIVGALGADTRLHVAGIPVSVSQLWRPLLLALLTGLIRWRLVRDSPLLGGVSVRDAREPDARLSWTERPLLPPHFPVIAIVIAAAALWPMRALLADLRSVPDPEDPLFSAWRVGWFAHQIVADPARLFDANIFHPAPLTFTYSDAHLLPSAIGAPLVWLGVDALAASNLLFVIALPLTALSYCIAAWRIVGDARASVIAGLLGGWYPFHYEHISHLELQWFCWIPLALVALHAALARGGWGRGAALGAAVAAQALSSMYFGLMLAAYLVPFAACLTAGWRTRLDGRHVRAALMAAAICLLPVLILGPPFLASRAARGDRPLQAVAEFSAEGRDYGIPNVNSATWGDRLGRDRKVERALFPGAVTLGLAALGAVPPLGVTAVAAIVSGALAFDWSLGVNGLTYDELRSVLLPFRGLRAPARFAVLVGTSLILLGAFGARRLFGGISSPRLRNAAFLALAGLVWIDLRPSVRLLPVWQQPPSIYAGVRPPAVLAEFPMRFRWNIAYMYFSTTHWAKLVNGYSGFLPESFEHLQNALGAFPEPPEALALVRQQGATHITVNCRFYGGDAACAPVLAALDGRGDLRLVARGRWEGSEVRLYELR